MQLNTLVVAEHKNQKLSPSTLTTISAATALGSGDVTVLVGGAAVDPVTEAAKSIAGVKNVLAAQHHELEHHLAEPWSALLTSLQAKLASCNALHDLCFLLVDIVSKLQMCTNLHELTMQQCLFTGSSTHTY